MKLFILAAAIGLTAFAQGPMHHPMAGPGGPMHMGPGAALSASDLSDLKTYLGLTDAQVTSLTSLVSSDHTANQATMDQLRAKEQALQTLLANGSTDVTALGQALLDIQNLRNSMKQSNTSLQTQALAILTADQKTKLATLQSAVSLMPTIHEAMRVFLLTPPAGAGPGPGMGPMHAGMMGGRMTHR